MINVKLLLTGRQRGEEGEESVTRTTADAQLGQPLPGAVKPEPVLTKANPAGSDQGQRPLKSQSYYILYDETLEEDVVCKNIIKLQGSTLELTKRGGGPRPLTRMVFEPGKVHNVNYSTPYGCLQMEVSTHRVEVFFEKELPQILAEYTLTSEGRLISRCLLEIKLQPV